MPSSPSSPAAALVLTEVYPPVQGGSGELMKNVYGRFTVPTTILTPVVQGEPETFVDGSVRVVRESTKAPGWGLAGGRALRHHLRRAGRVLALAAGPTVVHCCCVLPDGLEAWLAARRRRVPYLCWVHGEELMIVDSSRELRFLFDRVQRSAAALIANSVNSADLLEARGIDRARIHVVRPGVDTQRFRPDVPGAVELKNALAPRTTLLLVSVGRLQQRKGHDLVLKALALMPDSDPPVRYVIVGQGADGDRLRSLATELGVMDRVTFTGAVPADDLPKYYAAADIFVHPNRVEQGDFEGFGMVFLEAAAAGVPVIGGRSGGVPEAVDQGVTGLLVSGNDAAELRCAIIELARDSSRRRAIGCAARQRAEREFSWTRAVATVAALHTRIADGTHDRVGRTS